MVPKWVWLSLVSGLLLGVAVEVTATWLAVLAGGVYGCAVAIGTASNYRELWQQAEAARSTYRNLWQEAEAARREAEADAAAARDDYRTAVRVLVQLAEGHPDAELRGEARKLARLT